MKKTVVYLVLSLLLFSCTEFRIVNEDVPQAVVTAFKAKYPNATNPVWSAEKEDGHLIFEAGWKENKKWKEACFKYDGTFVKEE